MVNKFILQQGGCKNAFFNATLPENKVTVIRLPNGDLNFQEDKYWLLKKTLYGLRQSPHHWYNIIEGILLKMGLKNFPHDPCLLYGILDNPYSPQTISETQSQLHFGPHVDNFVFYSTDPTKEALFKTLLQEHIQVDFMGYVENCLGAAFTWLQHNYGNISLHLCQSAFTEFTAHCFSVQSANKVTNMTPYRSGFPIDYIPPVDPLYPDLPRRRQLYQIIFPCINWLETFTLPDITPVLTFLVSYINYPHSPHYNAAVHALKCLTSTNEYRISFHSKSSSTIQSFKHFPHHHGREAYTEATAPPPS